MPTSVYAKERKTVRKRSTARFVNGVISACIVVFFIAHSLLGGLEGIASLASPSPLIVWAGVGVIALHMLASVVTSYQQLTDAEFPPSARKKRHLLLKWATGAALALAAAAHVGCIYTFGPDAVQTSVASKMVVLVLVAVLAVHSWVGAKSLVTDLGLNKGLIGVFRVVVCALSAIAACFALAGGGM